MKHRIRLGVNIDHVATLRQARYQNKRKVLPWAEPRLFQAVRAVQKGGAHGITFHLREDRRHIQDEDLWTIQKESRLPLNMEMAANPEILKIVLRLKPSEVCLVPERREEVTTEGGLDVIRGGTRLQKVIHALQKRGILVSLFIAPDLKQIKKAAETGAEYVELHTGTFAEARQPSSQKKEFERLLRGAQMAHSLGLKVNAGHGINYSNVSRVIRLPHLETLNIGHSIVCRSIEVGLEKAVREMLNKMNPS